MRRVVHMWCAMWLTRYLKSLITIISNLLSGSNTCLVARWSVGNAYDLLPNTVSRDWTIRRMPTVPCQTQSDATCMLTAVRMTRNCVGLYLVPFQNLSRKNAGGRIYPNDLWTLWICILMTALVVAVVVVFVPLAREWRRVRRSARLL